MADELVGEVVGTPESTPADKGTGGSGSGTPESGVKPGAAPVKPAEDPRVAGILKDLQKERAARQAAETERERFRSDYDQERRRVQALAGVNPVSKEEAEVQGVREHFAKLFPGLAKLDDEKIERILAIAERADSLDEATTHHWATHGRQMLDAATSQISKALGGELSDRQSTRIKQAYLQEAESNPEFLARHEKGDPTLIKEFVQNWLEDWIEPAKRKVAQTEVERQRRVPSGRDRSVASTGGKKIDFNDEKAVADALVASYKANGGEFGS